MKMRGKGKKSRGEAETKTPSTANLQNLRETRKSPHGERRLSICKMGLDCNLLHFLQIIMQKVKGKKGLKEIYNDGKKNRNYNNKQ